jgi:hypothetical protein
MEWLGRTGRGGFILSFTAAEIEAIYDALDARNDRLENFQRPVEGIPLIKHEHDKLEADIRETNRISREFNPLVIEIRRDQA